MLRQQRAAPHQSAQSSRDLLWNLRAALFGKGLQPRSKPKVATDLHRPQPSPRPPAKAASLTLQKMVAPPNIRQLFAWCGPIQRRSDEGVHVNNWPSISPSMANSTRVSASGSSCTTPHAHQPQHTAAALQQASLSRISCTTPAAEPAAGAAVSTPAALKPASAPGALKPQAVPGPQAEAEALAGNCTICYCQAKPSNATCYHRGNPRQTQTRVNLISSNKESSVAASSTPVVSNKPPAVNPKDTSSQCSNLSSVIDPDNVPEVARLFGISVAWFLSMPKQQQEHMYIFATCGLQQNSFSAEAIPKQQEQHKQQLDNTATFEKEEQISAQQHRIRRAVPPEHQHHQQQYSHPLPPYIEQHLWLPVEYRQCMIEAQLEERRLIQLRHEMESDLSSWMMPDPEPVTTYYVKRVATAMF